MSPLSNLTLKDFCLTHNWENLFSKEYVPFSAECVQFSAEDWHENKQNIQFYEDKTTGRKYAEQNPYNGDIGAVFLAIPVNLLVSVINVAYRALKLISLSHFWCQSLDKSKAYDFKARATDAGIDILRIILSPILLVGLELSALYRLFRSRDGRALYASFERAAYGYSILSNVEQPLSYEPEEAVVRDDIAHVFNLMSGRHIVPHLFMVFSGN